MVSAEFTRPVRMPEQGHVVSSPQVGGLHHRYEGRAALANHCTFLGRFTLLLQEEQMDGHVQIGVGFLEERIEDQFPNSKRRTQYSPSIG